MLFSQLIKHRLKQLFQEKQLPGLEIKERNRIHTYTPLHMQNTHRHTQAHTHDGRFRCRTSWCPFPCSYIFRLAAGVYISYSDRYIHLPTCCSYLTRTDFHLFFLHWLLTKLVNAHNHVLAFTQALVMYSSVPGFSSVYNKR